MVRSVLQLNFDSHHRLFLAPDFYEMHRKVFIITWGLRNYILKLEYLQAVKLEYLQAVELQDMRKPVDFCGLVCIVVILHSNIGTNPTI